MTQAVTPSLLEIIYCLHVLCVLKNSNEGNYARFTERLNHQFLRLHLGYGSLVPRPSEFYARPLTPVA